MAKLIECRSCDSPICTGCNIHTLAAMLHKGKLDQLMDRHRSINAGADVAPVVHGRWKQFFEDWRQQMEGDECSVCGFQLFGGVKDWHYCPNCGAKMMEDSNGFS